ncbi:hypothetical protein EXN22_07665 [Pseudomonas tructae]|uniref:Uncharacterized protein n=1 Tax=Pseudomonas tructae TaxID=2518644 RepID=A0A411MFL8_9PSED|nr:hypothetical protein [Pseudomonas tructae]QBF25581.1 hypothetical protein EXN22_07665 [Pseudomonas tructae]
MASKLAQTRVIGAIVKPTLGVVFKAVLERINRFKQADQNTLGKTQRPREEPHGAGSDELASTDDSAAGQDATVPTQSNSSNPLVVKIAGLDVLSLGLMKLVLGLKSGAGQAEARPGASSKAQPGPGLAPSGSNTTQAAVPEVDWLSLGVMTMALGKQGGKARPGKASKAQAKARSGGPEQRSAAKKETRPTGSGSAHQPPAKQPPRTEASHDPSAKPGDAAERWGKRLDYLEAGYDIFSTYTSDQSPEEKAKSYGETLGGLAGARFGGWVGGRLGGPIGAVFGERGGERGGEWVGGLVGENLDAYLRKRWMSDPEASAPASRPATGQAEARPGASSKAQPGPGLAPSGSNTTQAAVPEVDWLSLGAMTMALGKQGGKARPGKASKAQAKARSGGPEQRSAAKKETRPTGSGSAHQPPAKQPPRTEASHDPSAKPGDAAERWGKRLDYLEAGYDIFSTYTSDQSPEEKAKSYGETLGGLAGARFGGWVGGRVGGPIGAVFGERGGERGGEWVGGLAGENLDAYLRKRWMSDPEAPAPASRPAQALPPISLLRKDSGNASADGPMPVLTRLSSAPSSISGAGPLPSASSGQPAHDGLSGWMAKRWFAPPADTCKPCPSEQSKTTPAVGQAPTRADEDDKLMKFVSASVTGALLGAAPGVPVLLPGREFGSLVGGHLAGTLDSKQAGSLVTPAQDRGQAPSAARQPLNLQRSKDDAGIAVGRIGNIVRGMEPAADQPGVLSMAPRMEQPGASQPPQPVQQITFSPTITVQGGMSDPLQLAQQVGAIVRREFEDLLRQSTSRQLYDVPHVA